jgi:hypothetical protein
MENDSNFRAVRRNGASRATRSDSSARALSSGTSADHRPYWRQTLKQLPDSRPEAVQRARKLIADPDYPPARFRQKLARRLAVQLKDEIDPLPT